MAPGITFDEGLRRIIELVDRYSGNLAHYRAYNEMDTRIREYRGEMD
jgi:hypothetical protein